MKKLWNDGMCPTSRRTKNKLSYFLTEHQANFKAKIMLFRLKNIRTNVVLFSDGTYCNGIQWIILLSRLHTKTFKKVQRRRNNALRINSF